MVEDGVCRVVCKRTPRKYSSEDVWRIYCNHLSFFEQSLFFLRIKLSKGSCSDDDDSPSPTSDDFAAIRDALRDIINLMDLDVSFLSELIAFIAGYAIASEESDKGVVVIDEKIREILRSRARGRNRLPVVVIDAITEDVQDEYSDVRARGRNVGRLRFVPQTEIGKRLFSPSVVVVDNLNEISRALQDASERIEQLSVASIKGIEQAINIIDELLE